MTSIPDEKLTAIRKALNAKPRDEDAVQAAYEALTMPEAVTFRNDYKDLFAQVTTEDAVESILPTATAPPAGGRSRRGRRRGRGRTTAKKGGSRRRRMTSKARRH
jgi:hypothetical protein